MGTQELEPKLRYNYYVDNSERTDYASMGEFPKEFRGLLIPVAVFEATAGILKSKFKKKWVFWVLLAIEAICATIQSVALIVQLYHASYSRVEYAAAYLTVIVDAILLVTEAYIVFWKLTEVDTLISTLSICGSVLYGTILGLSGIPIFIAKLRKRPLKRFKSRYAANLMLALPLLPVAQFLEFAALMVLDCGEIWIGISIIGTFLIPVTVSAVSLALGIVLLTRADNLSLSFLVISNLFPALATFVSAAFLMQDEEEEIEEAKETNLDA